MHPEKRKLLILTHKVNKAFYNTASIEYLESPESHIDLDIILTEVYASMGYTLADAEDILFNK
jgi:hypothetical protein